MKFVFRHIPPGLLLSIFVRLIFSDFLAWLLFRQSTNSVFVILLFIFGFIVLSFGLNVHIVRRSPLANAYAASYLVTLPDQSGNA